MNRVMDNARCSDVRDRATDIMLLEAPLAFIAEDHMRVKRLAEPMQPTATLRGRMVQRRILDVREARDYAR